MARVIGLPDGTITSKQELESKNGLWIVQRQFSITYHVLATTSETTEDVVLASGIPALFSTYGLCRCKCITPKENTTVVMNGTAYILWDVECEYDSKVDDSQNTGDSPENRRPTIGWTGDNVKEHFQKSLDDKKVQSTAGEPIFLEDEILIPILTITRYERAPFDQNIMLQFANCLNISTFYGAPRGSALMMPMEVPEEEEVINGVRYVKPKYRIKFKLKYDAFFGVPIQDTWVPEVLNQGYKYKYLADDGVTLKGPKIWLDESGNPDTVNLAEDGTILPLNADPIFLKFYTKNYAEFNALNLGPFG